MAKVSKVILGNEVLIDLTSDTITADKLLSGYTAHGKDGELVTGACTFDSDTSSDTATSDEILYGKTAHSKGHLVTGTMPNRGKQTSSISTKNQAVTISAGYHDGSGTVDIDATEKAKLLPGNILAGVSILGVEGTVAPASGVTAQSKTATPKTTSQTVLPDDGIDYLSQVTVNAIPRTDVANASGGITVTIAGE